MSKKVRDLLKKVQEERVAEFNFENAKKMARESEENLSAKPIIDNVVVDTEIEKEESPSLDSHDSMQVYLIPIGDLTPAPKEWNIYSNIHDDPERFADMLTSISRNGLLEPIIVWENREPGKYTVLAGHSRVEVYLYIQEQFGQEAEIFRRIPARVYKHEDLTPERAQEIVIDTNEVSRKEFSTVERVRAIAAKHRLIKSNRDYYFEQGITGKTRDIVGDQMNISPREVSYMVSLDKMPDHMLEMVDEKIVPFSFLKKISNSPSDVWEYVYKHRERLTPKVIRSVKNTPMISDIDDVIGTAKEKKFDVIQITVPEGEGKSLQEDLEDLLKDLEFKISLTKKRA